MKVTKYDDHYQTNEALGHIEALVKQKKDFSVSYKQEWIGIPSDEHGAEAFDFIIITEAE